MIAEPAPIATEQVDVEVNLALDNMYRHDPVGRARAETVHDLDRLSEIMFRDLNNARKSKWLDQIEAAVKPPTFMWTEADIGRVSDAVRSLVAYLREEIEK